MTTTQTSPLNNTVEAIQFINGSGTPGYLSGQLSITHDPAKTDVRAYEIYWGSSATEPLISPIITISPSHSYTAGNEILAVQQGTRYVFQQPLLHQFDHQVIPAGATHLLVYLRDTDNPNERRLYASRPLINENHLLPISATGLERSLSKTSARLGQIPLQLDGLWDPSRCPKALLPWLAWGLSMDGWYDYADNPELEERRRRELIRSNAAVHQHKGTVSALVDALQALGVQITITEWWQEDPPARPHTFKLTLSVDSSGGGSGRASEALDRQLKQAVDAVKPLSSHYTYIISIAQETGLRLAAAIKPVNYLRLNMVAEITYIINVAQETGMELAAAIKPVNYLRLRMVAELND